MTAVHPETPMSSPAVAPELAAAMAETRKVRDGYADLCKEFGPSPQTGWSARISLTVLNRHRANAGLDKFSRTESNDREDTMLRYRRERDQARQQLEVAQEHGEQMELERNDARHHLATCRERNAAIAVQLDQYRNERDEARDQLAKIRQACEHPEQSAGRTSGSGVINGQHLANVVLRIIGGA